MPKEITIRECGPAAALGRALIQAHHPALRDATVLYLLTNGKAKCYPKALVPFERYLASGPKRDPSGGADFAVVLNEDHWRLLEHLGGQRAWIDHVLSHCERVVTNDGTEVWQVNPEHPIAEFPDVVARHGLWLPALRDFGQQVHQLRLPAGQSDAIDAMLDAAEREVDAGGTADDPKVTERVAAAYTAAAGVGE